MRDRLPFLRQIAAVSMAASLGCAADHGRPPASGGSPAISATSLTALDGSPTDLRTVLRGRVAVVSFWATWCDACLAELEALERLHRQAIARGDAVVVGVAVGEARDVVVSFARSRRLGYAQLVDEHFRLADALGEPRVPATLVIDRAGRIVYRGGALDAAGLAAFREALRKSD